MASFNRVFLLGNITRDVQLRYLPSGRAVTDIGLAVNYRKKENNSWVESVDFFEVSFFGRTAEVAAEYARKGTPILIEGRLKLDTWEDAEGNRRSQVKVIGNSMQLLDSKKGGDNSSIEDIPL